MTENWGLEPHGASTGNAKSSTLATIDPDGRALSVPADLEAARTYIAESLSKNTRRAYKAAWAAFLDWCEAIGVDAQ